MNWNEVYFDSGKKRHVFAGKLGVLCHQKGHKQFIFPSTDQKIKELPMCGKCSNIQQDFL